MSEIWGSRRGQNRHPPGNTGRPYRKPFFSVRDIVLEFN